MLAVKPGSAQLAERIMQPSQVVDLSAGPRARLAGAVEVHDLALGPVSPIAAALFATAGLLLGIILITRARRRTGWRRVRLVAYAMVSVAGPGVWLPGLVGVMGLRVEGSVLLLTPVDLAYSLAAAAGGAAVALSLLCWGRPGALRQVVAAIPLVGAVAGTRYLMLESLATGGEIVSRTTPTGVVLALAAATGLALAVALAATRSLRAAAGGAVLLGLALASLDHLGIAALEVREGPEGPVPADVVAGLSPQRLGIPAVVLCGVLVALIWYFTLGTATLRELRLTFAPTADTEQIEPWMIEQVRARVALSSTASAPVSERPSAWAQNEPTVEVRAIPLVGGALAGAFGRRPLAHELAWQPMPAGGPPTRQPAAGGRGWAGTAGDHDAASAEARTSAGHGHRPPAAGNDRVEYTAGSGSTGANAGPAHAEPSTARFRRNDPRSPIAGTNSRYGPLADRPTHPDPDLVPVASTDPRTDLQTWAAGLRAESAALAAEVPEGTSIIRDYGAGSSLPRRNARPGPRP